MAQLCQLKNLSYSIGNKIIFNAADLTIQQGDKVGLLGLNGQGKSTLLKVIHGEVTPDPSKPVFEFVKSKGMGKFETFLVPQELPAHALNLSVRDFYLAFYPELYSIHLALQQSENLSVEEMSDYYEKLDQLHAHDIAQKYESYLKLFELDDWDRKLSSLSGGEQRKVALSLGLSTPIPFVLWDEPTNHLDLETIQLFEEELNASDKTFLLITHDRYLLNRVCKRIFHIQKGKIDSFEGSYFDYLQLLKQRDEERLSLLNLMQNHMRTEQAWMNQGVKARRTRSKERVGEYLKLKEKISSVKAEAKKLIQFHQQSTERKTQKLMEFIDVSFGFKQGEDLFHDINISLFKGQKVVLLGKNGAGKTTLINLILEKLVPRTGKIKRAENLSVAYFEQKREFPDLDLSPLAWLGEGGEFIEMPNGGKKHVVSYLESFLFSRDDLNRPIKTFSGGEKHRLQLAKFFIQKADLLIFDEPTNDLDLESIDLLEKNLKEFKGNMLLISHDRSFIEQVSDSAWILFDKKIEFFNTNIPKALEYFLAVAMEENEEEKEEAGEEKNPLPNKLKSPLNAQEKKRLVKLTDLIENKEKEISKLEHEIVHFNYSKNVNEAAQQAKKIQEDLEVKKEQLNQLIEEWSLLEEKSIQ